ncbi:MAG: hypothetical protein A3B86_03735 [Candidatus Yanofskybacteria bacterium RIFCSPHIGHO2_02_FULL_38_22b]|uniref:Uncharacterized protein n=1 Tax=Candidatus Yanofskybacteria bacterium RIFCSPHIGHO2_02_FULL_38_22b TaxID=1802673 RepID=A0A1F8EZB3_9BACT|nr:MAG: hypothetical protein A2816_01500 [Candidatus Yanofskybacteria bacterium RIFCSPHIGHO2_01_FULL_39_44]OGN06203.1 MAG: hypothetical protein A3B86_03735 [Candidatus Yanofskybacteria bacterium RIFCSPHIGHO2_02_FULL_38_22b]OGN19622.1 MAG: hypothetical protein A2910_03465 [Candidatus Yanofskybacteria bacterium RIFCSPLOWO2_01_FULL_39_28]
MIKGQYKKVLWEVFDVLGFLDDEKERALEGFKKKFASEMFKEVENNLSQNQRQWIAQVTAKKEYDKNDPVVSQIQETINSAYPEDELYQRSHKVFKKILSSYVDFMSQKVSSEKSEKLTSILNKI